MGDSASQFEKPIVFKKGKVIFVEGEPSAFLYVIVSGEIMIFKEGKGPIIPISLLGEKEFIGELSMFSDDPRNASAIAIEDSELLMIKRTDIRKVIKTCPEWVNNILMLISDRLRNTSKLLKEHRIVDEFNPASKKEFSTQELNQFQKSIKEYRERRGLKLSE